ncbi:hypothetical protein LCGC14_1493270 [marine sediment metagenome]|uniref:Uncharacterized protein n=1 Tax=marine sediment metagenome TaxID=412755 RepID=A0A0F9JS15_9ZZZZ
MARKTIITVGDQVGYRVNFLRSIGMAHSNMAHARGVVKSLTPFGPNKLAIVKWGMPDLPQRILDQNLARVGSLAFTSEDA